MPDKMNLLTADIADMTGDVVGLIAQGQIFDGLIAVSAVTDQVRRMHVDTVKRRQYLRIVEIAEEAVNQDDRF